MATGSYAITFTPTDAISTDSGELSYAVYTGAGATGALLVSGSATAGVEVTTSSFTDDYLDNGNNTRYLRLSDGGLNTYETSFNVEALFDQDVPLAENVVIDLTESIATTAVVPAADDVPADVEETIEQITLDGAADTLESDVEDSASVVININLLTLQDDLLSDTSDDAYKLISGIPVALDDTVEIDVSDSASIVETRDLLVEDDAEVEVEEDFTSTAVIPLVEDDVELDLLDVNWLEAAGSYADTVEADITEEVVGTAASHPDEAAADVEDVMAVHLEGAADTLSADVEDSASVEVVVLVADDLETEGTDAAGASLPQSLLDSVELDVSEHMSIEFSGADLTGNRLRITVLNQTGETVGMLTGLFSAGYGLELDHIGLFGLDLPASHPLSPEVRTGREIHIYREGEGLLFKGLVNNAEDIVTDDGSMVRRVEGDSIARELVNRSTYTGRAYDNVSMSSAVGSLLSGTGWSIEDVETDSRNVTTQFEGAQIWAALLHLAEMFGWHLREYNLSRRIDVGSVGSSSGLVFRNVGQMQEGMGVYPILRLGIREEQTELWNRVIPLGAGEGINALTLQHSDRTTPYTVKTMTGPDGETIYYLENEASIAEHGLREKVISFQDVIPISNSSAELRNAANALYDLSRAWLGWHSVINTTYTVDVAGLPHVVDGQLAFRVGETVRLQFRGLAERDDGEVLVWRNVDEELFIMGAHRSFDTSGASSWQFTVSTVDQHELTDETTLARALEDIWAIKTARKPYTYREISGPYVETADSGNNATFPIDFDDSVLYLRRAILQVRKRRVKSNVTGAASGGGATTVAGGGQTTTGGGGQTALSGGGHTSGPSGGHGHSVSTATTPAGGGHTSTAGENHTHNVSGGTAGFTGDHGHQIGTTSGTSAWAQQPFQQQLILTALSGSWGGFVGRGGSSSGTSLFSSAAGMHQHTLSGIAAATESSHRHNIQNHQHNVSGQSANSISNHNHSVSDHSHSVSTHQHNVSAHQHDMPAHTHALSYGIFLGPTASTPQMRVILNSTDRTVALGGPWNTDFEVDITPYLVDANGEVLRQSNNLSIQVSQLVDVEVTVKSLVTATSVVPV